MVFKQTIKLSNAIANLSKFQIRLRCTAASHQWDLLASVCVERHPRVTKSRSELEQKVQDLLAEIELENSKKSDHDLRLERERKQAEMMKKGMEIDADKVATDTAQDLEDAGHAQLAKFPFASRITEADKTDVKSSLDRKLDKCLVLLVQQKIGNDTFWLPPQGAREEGESLRQSAERILRNTCGDTLNAKIYGNSPIGFYKYVYPKGVRENGVRGAKIFFYLAKHVNGNVQQNVKYQWLDRQELEKTLPKPIHRSVSMFLVPE